MDSNRVSVFLRILGDNTDQYPHCVDVKSRNNLQLIESAEVMNFGAEGFEKRDKLAHSPTHMKSTPIKAHSPFRYTSQTYSSGHKRSRSTPSSARKIREVAIDYDLDFIFNSSDSLDYIYDMLKVDLQKNICIISLGRSGTLTDARGMMLRAMEGMFAHGYSVRMSCMSITPQKHMHYFDNGMIAVSSFEAGVNLLQGTEYFNRPKDPLVITSFILERDSYKKRVQFADFSSITNSTNTLIEALTNSDKGKLGNEKTLQILSKTLCYDSRIYLIGNIYPTVPHYAQTSTTLNLLKKVVQNRAKNNTLYCQLLNKEIQKCEKRLQSLIKDKQISSQNTDSLQSEILNLKKEKEILISRLNTGELEHMKISYDRLLMDYNVKDKELAEIKISYKELQASYNQLLMNSQVPTVPIYELEKKLKEYEDTIQELKVINKSLTTCMDSMHKKAPMNDQSTHTMTKSYAEISLQTDEIEVKQVKEEQELNKIKEVSIKSPLKEKPINHKDYYDLLRASWIYNDQMHDGLLNQINRMKQLMDFKVQTQIGKQELLKARLRRTQQIHAAALVQLQEKDNLCLTLQEQYNQLREKYASRSETYKKDFETFKEEARSKIKQLNETIRNKDSEIKSLFDRVEEGAEALKQFRDKHVRTIEEMKQMCVNHEKIRKDLTASFEQEKAEIKMQFQARLDEERKEFEEKEGALRELLISKNKKKVAK